MCFFYVSVSDLLSVCFVISLLLLSSLVLSSLVVLSFLVRVYSCLARVVSSLSCRVWLSYVRSLTCTMYALFCAVRSFVLCSPVCCALFCLMLSFVLGSLLCYCFFCAMLSLHPFPFFLSKATLVQSTSRLARSGPALTTVRFLFFSCCLPFSFFSAAFPCLLMLYCLEPFAFLLSSSCLLSAALSFVVYRLFYLQPCFLSAKDTAADKIDGRIQKTRQQTNRQGILTSNLSPPTSNL